MNASHQAPALPAWAEDVLRRFGPQPAHGAMRADPDVLAKYAAITDRLRRRWELELQPDVWRLFGGGGEQVEHKEQAQHLLGRMIDMARYGSRTELAAKRGALADVERVESELRDLAEMIRRKLHAHADMLHEHLIEGGIDDEALEHLGGALDAMLMQSWREPRLHNADFTGAISSRKTARDALNAMLYALEGIAPLLLPIKLTDKALATIFNVSHDTNDAENCGAELVKKARADLRRR